MSVCALSSAAVTLGALAHGPAAKGLPDLFKKEKDKNNTNNCLWWKNTAFHLSIVYLCPPKTNASRNGPRNQGCHCDWCQKLGPSHSLMIDSETQNGKH